MGDSYFLTGAFPAEYVNAISGVMDMRLRKGNDEKQEFTVQAGLIGFNVAAGRAFILKIEGVVRPAAKTKRSVITTPSNGS